MKQSKAFLIVPLIVTLLGIPTLLFAQWRGDILSTFDAEKGWFIALPFLFAFMVIAHKVESRGLSTKEYLSRLTVGGPITDKRVLYLDYARCIAVACVILTHACSLQIGEGTQMWRENILKACTIVGLVCNPLYVMISGALILSSKKEESILSFYYSRFIKVVLPFIIYYYILLIVSENVVLDAASIGLGFVQILKGPLGIAPHYWIIYIFISLYIFAPFLRTMVQNLSDKNIRVLTWMILIDETLNTFLPLLGFNLGTGYNFAGWVGVFLLGYIITSRKDAICVKAIEIAGLVCGVAQIILPVFFYDFCRSCTTNTSPVMVLFATWIILFLSRFEDKFKKRNNKCALALSKGAYSILLIHWQGLFSLVMIKMHIQPLRFGCIGGIILTVIIALLVCYVLGFLIDNGVVIGFRVLFSKVINRKAKKE